jgi:paraquat-inducible protein A
MAIASRLRAQLQQFGRWFAARSGSARDAACGADGVFCPGLSQTPTDAASRRSSQPAAHVSGGAAIGPRVLACEDCGLVQRVDVAQPGHLVLCTRCDARLERPAHGAPILLGAYLAMGLLLYGLALDEPLFQMHVLGRFASATLLTGPRLLDEHGLPEISALVVATLLVAPLVQLAILALAALGAGLRRTQRIWYWPLGLLEHARRWSMIDVYLLATLVCYVRLHAWSQVQVGDALLCLLALLFVSLAAHSVIDPRQLWARLPVRQVVRSTRATEPAPGARAAFLACHWCGLVAQAQLGEACARCGEALRWRKPDASARASALLATASLLSLPANMLPVMDTGRFGQAEPHTILGGVIELGQNGLYALAVVIFVASIVIPVLKIAGLALMIWRARRGGGGLRGWTRAYRFVRGIGRWSLVDVFAVTILVSLVHMGRIASVEPGYGALAFCAVVLLTMFAAEAFDPRLMWDAAGENPHPAQHYEGSHG